MPKPVCSYPFLAVATLGFHLAAATVAARAQAPPPPASQPDPAAQSKGRFLRGEQRVPVTYESVDGGVFFQMKVADQDLWALLDSSAAQSRLDIEVARAAKLELMSIEKPRPAKGSVQVARDVLFVVPGQIEASYPQFAVGELGGLTTVGGQRVQLVLGQDWMRKFAIVIDPSRKSFQLAPSGAFKAPPTAKLVDLQGTGRPQVELVIGAEKLRVTVGTGFNGQLMLSPAAWARVVPKDAKVESVTMGGGGEVVAKKTTLSEVEIASVTVPAVEAREVPVPWDSDGIIGMAILGKFRMAIDLQQGKMWLGAAPPPGAG